jgi:hypothetical protein
MRRPSFKNPRRARSGLAEMRDISIDMNHFRGGTLPVFDRGQVDPGDEGLNSGREVKLSRRFRTAADRLPGKAVTQRLLGDPRPGRAGRAPDCEDSLRAERSAEAYRLMGQEPPQDGYGVKDLDRVKARLELLKPRRWRPMKDAAE